MAFCAVKGLRPCRGEMFLMMSRGSGVFCDSEQWCPLISQFLGKSEKLLTPFLQLAIFLQCLSIAFKSRVWLMREK
jgi:hypothetical protein